MTTAITEILVGLCIAAVVVYFTHRTVTHILTLVNRKRT